MDIVSWTLSNPRYDADKPIFIDALEPSRSISASQARRYVRQLVAGFRAAGLRRGHTVCILTLSSIYYPIFFLAIVGAGGRVVGGNPGHTVHELKHLITKCSVKFIITETPLLDKATAAASGNGIDQSHVYLCDSQGGLSAESRSWRRLLQYGESDWDVLTDAEAAQTPTAYYSTSGTTGAPKFAAVSHGYQVANGKYIELETLSKPYAVSRLVSLPLMHAFAAPLVHCAALRSGTPTYILSRFSVPTFVSTILRFSITEFPVVPSMLIALTSSSACTALALRSVREVICAGAPLSTSLASSFSALLTAPSARLIQLYGATEAGWISSTPYKQANNFPRTASITSPSFPLHAPTPTVGTPLPGFQMRLVHTTSNLRISTVDTPGALQVKAPHPFMYYLDAEKATRDSFTTDGWLKTGDIATRDSHGRYYIVDREKDMIKVRGWQVAPAEIESVLAAHSAVEDCAIIGVEDTEGACGEVAWAFVAAGASVSEAELKAWIRERLAGYKVPARISLVPKIPRNPAGKILRRVLKEEHIISTKQPKMATVVVATTTKNTVAVAPTTTTTPTVCEKEKKRKECGEMLSYWSSLARDRRTSWPIVAGYNGRWWPQLQTQLPLHHGGGSSDGVQNSQSYSRWTTTVVILLPAGLILGLGVCLWRTELAAELRRYWPY